jgi:hypothetical protein
MRLWTLSPSLLDRQGLLALWREGLLALNVLQGKTKGYRNHPQLNRFRDNFNSLVKYLHSIVDEAERRGYKFNRDKLPSISCYSKIRVSKGQIYFEWNHLSKKLSIRSPEQLLKNTRVEVNPLFTVDMDINELESWEIIRS